MCVCRRLTSCGDHNRHRFFYRGKIYYANTVDPFFNSLNLRENGFSNTHQYIDALKFLLVWNIDNLQISG